MADVTLCVNWTRAEVKEKILAALDEEDGHSTARTYDDSGNSYKYILFVLVVYAGSFLALMLKYFRKSDNKDDGDNLYEEFVKRDSFRTKLDVETAPGNAKPRDATTTPVFQLDEMAHRVGGIADDLRMIDSHDRCFDSGEKSIDEPQDADHMLVIDDVGPINHRHYRPFPQGEEVRRFC